MGDKASPQTQSPKKTPKKPKPSMSWTFQEKYNQASDFLRFLETEKINLSDGVSKKKVGKAYNKEYKAYREQIAPAEKLIPYHLCMQTMFNRDIVHLRGVRLFKGPRPSPSPEREIKSESPEKEIIYNRSIGVPSQSAQNQGRSAENSLNVDANGNVNQNSVQPTRSRRRRRLKHNKPVISYSDQPGGQEAQLDPRKTAMADRLQRLRKKRTWPVKVAVDQHLTIHRPEPHADDTGVEPAGASVNVTDMKYIKRVEDENYFTCRVCHTSCTSEADVERHLTGKVHRLAVVMDRLKTMRLMLIEDKFGIEITSKLRQLSEKYQEGTYLLDLQPGDVYKTTIAVKNNGNCDVELLHCEMLKKIRVFTLSDEARVTDAVRTVVIKPGETYGIDITTNATNVGNFHCPLVFFFRQLGPEEPVFFHIVRFIHARCKSAIMEDLKPVTPYRKPPRVARSAGGAVEIVPGLKMPQLTGDNLRREIGLVQYNIPQNVRTMINRGLKDTGALNQGEKVELSALKFILENPIDMGTHQRRFEALLHFEEIQMEVDIRKYDMENVIMTTHPDNRHLLLLQVPGLAENRPSVLKGDWLFVRLHEADGQLSKKEYQGYVHEVRNDEVALGFDKSLRESFINNQKFTVRFVFNRLAVRLQHRACELASELSLGKMLFPTKDIVKSSERQLPHLLFYNTNIEKNEEQKCAVQHIVAGTSRPAPYLVFGPPGTGKTVTIVEAMKQVHKVSPGCHILASAPSNSAADLITRRLLQHIPKSHILRLNAVSRAWITIPEEIRDVCNYDWRTKQYFYPTKEEICQFKVVITTLVTAGRIASANFPSGHFTHIFIDEAGHAVEPETLIAISGIMEANSGQVVLAGDPKQLGPILRSPFAIKYGLGISLLERFMSLELYRPNEGGNHHQHYNTAVITKLLRNYRSHPAILKLPNEMFYNSELLPCANAMDREKLCQWDGLPKKGFPVLFHSVIGEDMREERSPSFFNTSEAAVVMNYVEDLLQTRRGGIKLKPEDIGIISPYRKQVQKIQQALRKKRLEKINVGSVEEFQGQERTVIIVSTVRSKPEYLSMDVQFKLGFLRNPKRFNVTVTRAKALLIVIGNPNTLSKDEHWNSFIQYCLKAGSYKGPEILPEDDEVEDLIQRFSAVSIIDCDKMDLTPEVISQYNEQAWRSET